MNRAPRERAPLVCPRATVAMAFALTAAVWLMAHTHMPAATGPQMCTTEKLEAPTPSGESNKGSASVASDS